MDDAAVHAHGLGRRYGSQWALRDCDVVVPVGRVVALVGPNGAGKTTLLRLIVGLLRPSAGSVDVFGVAADTNTAAALALIAFVAQDHPLYRRFTVADHLRFGAALNPAWDQVWAQTRLAALDIPLDRPVGKLSGGQQSQVALVIAVAKRPRLLVLDEPLASLDPLARRAFLHALTEVNRSHPMTVLFSSHVVNELERVCDHVVVVTDGLVRVADDIDEILANHHVVTGTRGAVLPAGIEPIAAIDHDTTRWLVRSDHHGLPAPWHVSPAVLDDVVIGYLTTSSDVPVRA